MDNELKSAKEIFQKYSGSYFFMVRDGYYEKYKNFSVPRDQELLWVYEYQQQLLHAINEGTDNNESIVSKALSILTTIRAYKQVDTVLQLINTLKNPLINLDSFSKMIIAENSLETVKSLNFDKNLIENSTINNLRTYAIGVLHSIVTSPINVDITYLNKMYLREEVKEDSIIERIQRILTEWEK